MSPASVPVRQIRGLATKTNLVVTLCSAAVGVAALVFAWTTLLPPVLKTAAMAMGFGLLGLGFVTAVLSFFALVTEGRDTPRNVPVLAVRLSLSLVFMGWVGYFLLSGAGLFSLSAELTLWGGAALWTILYLSTVVMGNQVDHVAESEADKRSNLDRIALKASRVSAEIELSGTPAAKQLVAQVVEEVRYLSPSTNQEAWDTELEILQTLTDLVGTTGSVQIQSLEKLLLLIGIRRKIHD